MNTVFSVNLRHRDDVGLKRIAWQITEGAFSKPYTAGMFIVCAGLACTVVAAPIAIPAAIMHYHTIKGVFESAYTSLRGIKQMQINANINERISLTHDLRARELQVTMGYQTRACLALLMARAGTNGVPSRLLGEASRFLIDSPEVFANLPPDDGAVPAYAEEDPADFPPVYQPSGQPPAYSETALNTSEPALSLGPDTVRFFAQGRLPAP